MPGQPSSVLCRVAGSNGEFQYFHSLPAAAGVLFNKADEGKHHRGFHNFRVQLKAAGKLTYIDPRDGVGYECIDIPLIKKGSFLDGLPSVQEGRKLTTVRAVGNVCPTCGSSEHHYDWRSMQDCAKCTLLRHKQVLLDSYAQEEIASIVETTFDKGDYYVYVHFDASGKVCYYGKGVGARVADTASRKTAHAKAIAKTRIVADNLSEEMAFEVEGELIRRNKPRFNVANGHNKMCIPAIITEVNRIVDAIEKLIKE